MSHAVHIVINGVGVDFSFEAAANYVREADAGARTFERQEAERLALAGWVMIKLAEGGRYGSIEHVRQRIGVNSQRGGRMARYAEAFIDPATGTFREIAWQEAVAAAMKNMRASGSHRLKKAERPSLKQIDYAVGARKMPEQNPTPPRRGREAFGFDDDLETSLAEVTGGADRMTGWKPVPLGGGRDAGCVGAVQEMLPFHLAESARRAVTLSERIERRLAAGEIDQAMGERVQRRLDEVLGEMAELAD